MYNNPTEPIPLFLPVAAAAQLRPWFDTATLDLGLEEIRRRQLLELFRWRPASALKE